MTISDATTDDKVGIMTNLLFSVQLFANINPLSDGLVQDCSASNGVTAVLQLSFCYVLLQENLN